MEGIREVGGWEERYMSGRRKRRRVVVRVGSQGVCV